MNKKVNMHYSSQFDQICSGKQCNSSKSCEQRDESLVVETKIMAGPGQSKEKYRKEFLQSEVALLAEKVTHGKINIQSKEMW